MNRESTESGAQSQPSAFAAIPRGADWAVYAGIVLCCVMTAWFGADGSRGDTIAYINLSDAIQHHLWHAAMNASWFPGYPAVLTLGRAVFGYRLKYDLLAARMVDLLIGLAFIASSVVLAAAVRHLMIVRRIKVGELLPMRTLSVWVATFAYFFLATDLLGTKPDALLSVFILLSVAALLWGIAEQSLVAFVAAGLLGGLAYWTKAFAFPFFCLWIFFAALVNLRNYRVLGRLVVAFAVFALVAGPYVWHISAARGRFTIGDSGRVNTAWYVNGAERFNPVVDRTIYSFGQAKGSFKHPAELLSTSPEITYYGGDKVYGSMPEWDDFSYWADGIAPHVSVFQYVKQSRVNLGALANVLPMRVQALLLMIALACWGFMLRRRSLADPILLAMGLTAFACIGLYVLVHLEARYIVFTFMMLGVLFAAASVTQTPGRSYRSLHMAVLLMAGLIVVAGMQRSLREEKEAVGKGDNPLHGRYDMAVFNAGAALAAHYPQGGEVVCLGHAACFDDSLWARFGGVRASAVISIPHQEENGSVAVICGELAANPLALESLRQHNLRAIVGRFENTPPCSAAWRPLGKAPGFYYLPL